MVCLYYVNNGNYDKVSNTIIKLGNKNDVNTTKFESHNEVNNIHTMNNNYNIVHDPKLM